MMFHSCKRVCVVFECFRHSMVSIGTVVYYVFRLHTHKHTHTHTHTHTAALMVLGLGSFAKSFSHDDDTILSSISGWSYSVGWVGCVISLLCSLYFISVAVYRICNPSPRRDEESKSYAPLAQFESTETGSDDDDNL